MLELTNTAPKKVLAKPLEIGQILGNFVSKVALEVSRDLHGRC